MTVTGGENVYSIEVEDALASHSDVDQVAVIGIPDARWGEAVDAIVVLHVGATVDADEPRAWARRTIAGFKVPESIELRTEPLPQSGALRRLLRAPHWADQ